MFWIGKEVIQIKMDELVSYMLEDSLRRAIAFYGLEGAEQKIKELYKNMPVLKEAFLNKYNWNLMER